MAKNKTRQKKHSYVKAVTIAVFAMLFIGAIIGCVIGWLQVSNLTTKLEAITQTEAEEGDSAVSGDVMSFRRLAKSSELVAPDTATTYAVVTEGTYTELPAGVRHIEVGDDLSGVLLYIDYPNLSGASSLYLQTENYHIWKQSYSGMCFGYSKGVYQNATQATAMETFCAMYSGANWQSMPITSYELPADFGEVTSVNTNATEHSALYIVEGGTSGGEVETPTYTLTNTSPLPGHDFECGTFFFLSINNNLNSYTDGYLCVNVKSLKPLMSQAGSSVNIMTVNSQNGLYINNGALNYVYMGLNTSGTGSEQKTLKLCDGSTASDYVYVKIDLQNVSYFNEEYVTANTMRYLTDASHVHLTSETDFPVEGCTADCIMQFRDETSYGEGYIVIKTAAFNTYAASHSGKLFYTDNHNYNYFEIENGVLKYCQYLHGSEAINSMTVYDGNTDTEYFYVHLTGMTFNLPTDGDMQFQSAIIGYLTTEHQNYTLPEQPEKEGYDFVGWFYGTEADHREAENTTEKTCKKYNGEHITSDTSFHAHFAIKTFTVTYDTNGGGEKVSATVNWNTRAPIPEVSRTGYNLAGWYLPDGTEYTGQAIKSDTTLKAEWVIKVFTVTFYVEGKAVKAIDVTYGTQLTEASEAAEISIQNIIAASYVNEQITDVALTEMLVVDDMKVQLTSYEAGGDNVLSEPTAMDKFMSVLQQYKILFIVCAVIVCAGVIAVTVLITKKLNGRR